MIGIAVLDTTAVFIQLIQETNTVTAGPAARQDGAHQGVMNSGTQGKRAVAN